MINVVLEPWANFQFNQGSEVESDSTLEQMTTCGVSNTSTLLSGIFFNIKQ